MGFTYVWHAKTSCTSNDNGTMHFIDDYSFAGQPRLQPDRTSPKFFTKECSCILRLATATPRIEDPSIRNSKTRGSFVYSKSDSPSKHDMMFSEATSIVRSGIGSDRLPFGLALLHMRRLVNGPALIGPQLQICRNPRTSPFSQVQGACVSVDRHSLSSRNPLPNHST